MHFDNRHHKNYPVVGLNSVLITTRTGCSIRAKNQKILILNNRNKHELFKIAQKIGPLSNINEFIFVIHYNTIQSHEYSIASDQLSW